MASQTNKKLIKAKETVIKKAGETGKYVAKNPKTIGYGLLAVLGVIAVYKISTGVSDKLDVFFNPDVDDAVDIDAPTIDYDNATITQYQAQEFAQQLLDAMNVNRNSLIAGGTDEDTIEAVFNLIQNKNDFLMVNQAFGRKDYNGYNSPVEGIEWLDSYTPRPLIYWLQSELSSVWESTTYSLVKSVVEDAGFAF